MQKARRHHISWLRPLVGARVQGLFHPPCSGYFSPFPRGTGSLSVSRGVFSLARRSWRIQAGFLVSRPYSGYRYLRKRCRARGCHPPRLTFPGNCTSSSVEYRGPMTPLSPKRQRFGLFPRSLATTGGITFCFLLLRVMRCFSSPRSPALMHDRHLDGRVAPFGNPRVKGYLHLAVAYRGLSRPSSPPRA